MPDGPQRIAERRLSVWRLAYALFDRGTSWEGPFHSCGYHDPVIEPTLDNGKGPDMLAANENFFALLEISSSANKDFASAREYSSGGLTPFLRTRIGDRPRKPAGAPFFVTTESGIRSFPPDMNAIRVSSPVETYLSRVEDSNLRESLTAWTGFPIPVPSYSLLALPESDPEEIRLQLGGILKKIATEGGEIPARKLADMLLGDLSDAVTDSAKARLTKNVATLLEIAASKLDPYVSWLSQSRSVKVEKVESSQGRAAFSRAISEWAQVPFLESFSHYESESERGGDNDA